MALDEPKEDDEIVEREGVKVVATRALLKEMGGIEVDFRSTGWGRGFDIRPKSDRLGRCGC